MKYTFETCDEVVAKQMLNACKFEREVWEIKNMVRNHLKHEEFETVKQAEQWVEDLYEMLCELPWEEE